MCRLACPDNASAAADVGPGAWEACCLLLLVNMASLLTQAAREWQCHGSRLESVALERSRTPLVADKRERVAKQHARKSTKADEEKFYAQVSSA